MAFGTRSDELGGRSRWGLYTVPTTDLENGPRTRCVQVPALEPEQVKATSGLIPERGLKQ